MDQVTDLLTHKGIPSLTDREKETLRLLFGGHDAKSIARYLGLSVHTINERLRDARRKLDVSSSREAARLLAQTERGGPDSLADKVLGVPDSAGNVSSSQQARRWYNAAHRLAWFGGGMFIMSLVIAAFALSSTFHGNAAPAEQATVSPAMGSNAPTSASLGAAREWLALLDHQRWDESWRTAAALFKSHVTAAQWASTIQSVMQPLGKASTRTFRDVTKTSALPGAPAGEYEVLQFQTSFAGKNEAIETVTLARDQSGWKVAGYFIR